VVKDHSFPSRGAEQAPRGTSFVPQQGNFALRKATASARKGGSSKKTSTMNAPVDSSGTRVPFQFD